MSLLSIQSYFHVTHDVVTWKPRVECRFVVADLVRLCVSGLWLMKKYRASGALGNPRILPLLIGGLVGCGTYVGVTWLIRREDEIQDLRRRLAAAQRVNPTGSSTVTERLID